MKNSYEKTHDLLGRIDEERKKADDFSQELMMTHMDAGAKFWPSMASIAIQRVNSVGHKFTEVVGSCLRKNYYMCKNEPVTDPVGTRVADSADLGNLIEDMLADRIKQLPDFELVFPNISGRKLRFRKNGVSGEIDIVTRHIASKELIGVEIKSYDGPWAALGLVGYEKAAAAYGSAMPYIPKFINKDRKRKNPVREKLPFPKEDHLLQTMMYLDEFEKSDIKLFKIIYVGRDKGPKVEFDVRLKRIKNEAYPVVNGIMYEDYKLSSIYDRYNQLAVHVENNTLPPKDYNPEYSSDQILNNPNFTFEDGTKPSKSQIKKVEGGGVLRHWRCEYCSFFTKCSSESDNDLF